MAIIQGGAGNDTLTGTAVKDNIYGRAGDDIMRGLGGGDHMFGNDGNDTLYGGDGDDFMDGGNGNDTLYGEGGTNTVNGMAGDDLLISGTGRDALCGNAGNDTFRLLGKGLSESASGWEGDDRFEVYARAISSATKNTFAMSGDDGFDTAVFTGRFTVNGEAMRSLVLTQPDNESSGYRMDFVSLHHTVRQGGSLTVERHDFSGMSGTVDLRLKPHSDRDAEFVLTNAADKVSVDMSHEPTNSTIDLEAFTAGKDVIKLTGGVTAADVAVTYDASGTTLTVNDGLEIHVAGVSLTSGIDWMIG